MSFGKIRIDPADAAFSRYVRLSKRRCEYCGKAGQGPEGIHGLEASHFFGRRRESVRFDLENVDPLCNYHHRHLGENPEQYRSWKLKQLGQVKFNALVVRANSYQKKDRKLQAIIWRQAIKELNL